MGGRATVENLGGGFAIGSRGGTVRNCRVKSCSGQWGGLAGISVLQRGGLVSSCLIDGNSHNHSQSGTVLVTGGVMENTVIANNIVHHKGGGLWVSGGVVRNCTIVRNTATDEGCGVYREKDGRLENCIVWGNINRNDPNSPNREIFGATPESVVNCCYPGADGTGTVTENPLFVDAEHGDFHLRAGSPCIDAGMVPDGISATDYAGNARQSGASVDIGAFEYEATGLDCGFRATLSKAPAPLGTVLHPVVHGTTAAADSLELLWTLDPGNGLTREIPATGLEDLPVSLPAGLYSVTLKVTDPATGTSSEEAIPGFLVSCPETIHVVAENGNAAPPYDTWENAATNLNEAFALADEGSTMLVSNGVYTITKQLVLDRPMTLVGVNGRAETIVQRGPSGGRLCMLDNPGASVKGITFRRGTTGTGWHGNVLITSKGGLFDHCRITENVSGSYDSNGVGLRLEGGRASGCMIDANKITTDSMQGSGVYQLGGCLENCLVISNFTYSLEQGVGAGVALVGPGVIRNCTITRNRGVSGGGVFVSDNSSRVQNCIIIDNVTGKDSGPGAPNWQKASDQVYPEKIFSTNCIPQAIGPGCISASPDFTDAEAGNYSLAAGSPCIDAGAPLDDLAETDFAGNPRLMGEALDIGAIEFDAREPGCGISVNPTRVVAPAKVTFTASTFAFQSDSSQLKYTWTFGTGAGEQVEDGIGLASVDFQYTVPGLYNAQLEVLDPATDQRASIAVTNAVLIAPTELYVVTTNDHCRAPYDSWETAATNFHEALSWTADGSTITVDDGVYHLPGAIHLENAIRLRSVNGYGSTTLQGPGKAGVRVVELHHDKAIVDGFTISGGYTAYIGFGGGVNMERGELRHCLITGNDASGYSTGTGVNLLGGLVSGCVISNNARCDDGGGISIEGGICENSIITASEAGKGGGVLIRKGVLRNSTITGNSEISSGGPGAGGVFHEGGTVENCIIWGNQCASTEPGPGGPDWATTFVDTSKAFLNNCTSSDVGSNCIVADPLFRDAEAGDYRIRPNSPCRDAGLYREWMENATDFWGNPRVDVQQRVDIGAHEETSSKATMLMLR